MTIERMQKYCEKITTKKFNLCSVGYELLAITELNFKLHSPPGFSQCTCYVHCLVVFRMSLSS